MPRKVEPPPAMMLYVNDFVSDPKVEAMDTEEVGAYFLICCKAWKEPDPGTIPDDDKVLARWARLTPSRWTKCKSAVLAAFKPWKNGRLVQKRMRAEFDKYKKGKTIRVLSARKAAKSRWIESQKSPLDEADKCGPHAYRNQIGMRKNAMSTSTSRKDVSLRASSSETSNRPEVATGARNGHTSDVDADALKDFSDQDGQAHYELQRTARLIKPSREPKQRAKDLDTLAKFVILSQTIYGSRWLPDAIEAVRNATKKSDNPVRHLYGVLRSKARELGRNLNRDMARTEVPRGMIESIDGGNHE